MSMHNDLRLRVVNFLPMNDMIAFLKQLVLKPSLRERCELHIMVFLTNCSDSWVTGNKGVEGLTC